MSSPSPYKITFYDLPTKSTPPKAWSLNPWKSRLVLNYKSLPYTTQWVEYPDIAPMCKSFGLSSNDGTEGTTTAFTIPTICVSETSTTTNNTDDNTSSSGGTSTSSSSKKTYSMDSRAIATLIESLSPSPSLHLDSPVLKEIEELLPQIHAALFPVTLPRVPRFVLPPRSAEYFARTRRERLGMPLEEFEKSEKGGEEAWGAVEELLERMAGLLGSETTSEAKEDGDGRSSEGGGPFFGGSSTPSYADFVVVAFLRFTFALGEEDVFGRIVGMQPALGRLYRACGPWLERED